MPAVKNAARTEDRAEEPASRADAYAELGLTPVASDDEVRDAFRVRIKTAHPDLNGGTDAMLRRLILARDLLMEPRQDGPDALQNLARGDEPVRLDITLTQAIAGGEGTADVPALEVAAAHEPLTSLTQMKRLAVPLRPGLRNGDIVRVPTAGPRGEQAFRVHIACEEGVRVWGDDIWMTAAIEARLLAIGGTARVGTPHGEREIMLDKDTVPGSSLHLKGLGLPMTEACPAGNLHIRLEAQAPEAKPYREVLGAFRQRWAS